MPVSRFSPYALAGALLYTSLFLAGGCGSISDQTLVTDSPLGAVYLQHLFDRGTTMRYGGPVKSFKTSHPFELSPELAAKTLSGLRVGITTTDEPLLRALTADLRSAAPKAAGAVGTVLSNTRRPLR